MTFGAQLQALRKDRGLSFDELAQRCGCNRTTVYKAERGDRYPSLDRVRTMLRVLGHKPGTDAHDRLIALWAHERDRVHGGRAHPQPKANPAAHLEEAEDGLDEMESYLLRLRTAAAQLTPAQRHELLRIARRPEIIDGLHALRPVRK